MIRSCNQHTGNAAPPLNPMLGTLVKRTFAAAAFVAALLPNCMSPSPAHCDASNDASVSSPTITPSGDVTPNAGPVGPAARFRIGVHVPIRQNQETVFNFQALDLAGNPVPSYAGAAKLTTSAIFAVLPAQVIFVGGVANNVRVTFTVPNLQTFTITDINNAAVTTTTTIQVAPPGPAVTFKIVAPANVNANVPFNFTIAALDGNGNTATNYTGTIHFTSNSPGNVPFDISIDKGKATLSANLFQRGRHNLTATDTVSPAVTGGTNVIVQ